MTILSGKARLAGITGWPVSHSRSPRLHGFWLERYGIDGAYVPLPIEPAHFPAAIRGLMLAGFAGVNVHHPAQGRRLCDLRRCRRIRPRAGAVNTLVFDERPDHAAATPMAGAFWRTCAPTASIRPPGRR